MRPNLKQGQLVAPPSFNDGLRRKQELAVEMANITRQLDDPGRKLGRSEEEYENWRTSAKFALRRFKREEIQLDDWLKANEPTLFRQAYDVLKGLSEDVDLDDHELQVLDQLAHYFQTT